MALQLIGKQAAWLVKANLSSAHPGLFVVTGDDASWKSRFIGSIGIDQQRLPDGRIMFGSKIIVDTRAADVFILPRFRDKDYWVIAQSPDGHNVAIYWQATNARRGGTPSSFNIAVLSLDTGKEVTTDVKGVPAVPAGGYIVEFYPAWYREHCAWKALLTCQ